ncbi:MAG TPA: SsrA-binding protein SmpB [Candidatus Dormibacteraeota bacterium]|nr:SsrA-binding protein SmpB [Candidatus Dormibacteraeota bacterium]
MSKDAKDRDVAVNRRAFHDYFIDEKYEAGVMLTGTEVKSVRNGRANLRDGFVRIDNGEAWLENVHISPYAQGNLMNHDPLRARKLLLHRKEISSLIGKVKQRGYTLIPLRIYFTRNHAKVEVGLARGKREYDKREAIAAREAKREIERAMRR